ncbi:MAG: TonB-dependent receptor, partial [Oceanobacter sp.]
MNNKNNHQAGGLNVCSGRRAPVFKRNRLASAVISVTIGCSAISTLVQAEEIEEVLVIAPTPVAGAQIAKDALVAPAQQLDADDLERTQAMSLAEHLRYQLGSVSINEAISNPYQPDVQYRGFTASPLLGLPQGMSIYMNGVRFNEPFGDTVNWDLLPTDAIHHLTLHSGSNPLFGQNTLGGSISLLNKNGFNTQGNEVELGAGQFGYRQAQFQSAGEGTLKGENLGYYLVVNREEED